MKLALKTFFSTLFLCASASLPAQNVYQWFGPPGTTSWTPENNWVQEGTDPRYHRLDFDGIIEFIDGDVEHNTVNDKFPEEIFEIRFNASADFSVSSTFDNVGFSAQAFQNPDDTVTFYNSSIQNIGTGLGTIDFNLSFFYPGIISYGEIDAVNGDLIFNGTVGVTPDTSDTRNFVAGLVLYGSNGRTVTFNKSIDGTGKSFLLSGNNLVHLNSADSFSGPATIAGGTLDVAADGALGSISGLTINSGGTLLLSNSAATDRVGDTVPIQLVGGTIRKANGVTEGTSTSVGLGALALSQNSTVDFTCTNGALTFGSFTPNGYVLSIVNYNSNGSPGGSDQLIFAQDQSSNLSSFDFGRGPGVGVTESLVSAGFYEVHPAAPASPQISSVAAHGPFTFSFTTVTGQTYEVKYTEDLSSGNWTPLPGYESRTGDGNPIDVTDSSASSVDHRFYEVVTTIPGLTCGATTPSQSAKSPVRASLSKCRAY